VRAVGAVAIAVIFAVVGLSVFFYKWQVLGYPIAPTEKTDTWNLEVRIDFAGDGDAVKASLMIPPVPGPFAILDESFVSQGFGLSTFDEEALQNRTAVWSRRAVDDDVALYYRALLYRLNSEVAAPGEDQAETAAAADVEADTEDLSDAEKLALEKIAEQAKDQSADQETLVASIFSRLTAEDADDVTAVVLGDDPSDAKRVAVAVQVLRIAGVEARSVHGVELMGNKRDAPLVHWIEIVDEEGAWVAYRPGELKAGIPRSWLPWWRGDLPMVDLDGGSALQSTIAVSKQTAGPDLAASVSSDILESPLAAINLTSLPINTQLVYRVLLMIPVGALVLVILRQLIGVQTFGTFMPVLIALSFRETQLIHGVILFVGLVAMGLLIRQWLEKLRLLTVPRLAVMLAIVVLVMAATSKILDRFDLGLGLSVALFPMVILTMTIERMSVMWEEYGGMDAIKQGLGSLAVAVVAYLCMSQENVEYLAFTFPELLLVLIALMIVIGRYTGFRLVELYRFRHLLRQDKS